MHTPIRWTTTGRTLLAAVLVLGAWAAGLVLRAPGVQTAPPRLIRQTALPKASLDPAFGMEALSLAAIPGHRFVMAEEVSRGLARRNLPGNDHLWVLSLDADDHVVWQREIPLDTDTAEQPLFWGMGLNGLVGMPDGGGWACFFDGNSLRAVRLNGKGDLVRDIRLPLSAEIWPGDQPVSCGRWGGAVGIAVLQHGRSPQAATSEHRIVRVNDDGKVLQDYSAHDEPGRWSDTGPPVTLADGSWALPTRGQTIVLTRMKPNGAAISLPMQVPGMNLLVGNSNPSAPSSDLLIFQGPMSIRRSIPPILYHYDANLHLMKKVIGSGEDDLQAFQVTRRADGSLIMFGEHMGSFLARRRPEGAVLQADSHLSRTGMLASGAIPVTGYAGSPAAVSEDGAQALLAATVPGAVAGADSRQLLSRIQLQK